MSSATTFGKYLLLERINIGGMAEVFKAKTFGIEGFERVLAVKRILPNMAEDEEFINMFIDEARVAVQLAHPNIVTIYELGKFENQYYIAMEYVPGKDLRQLFDRFRETETTMPLPAAAYLVSKICEGLDYAHRKADAAGRPLNVIHRDVSPQNILVSYEGAVKITDFGIVKAEDRASKTQAGVLKGKFGYMSPEQVRGLEIDRRSDIFAVGILLYEALTGQRLFIGESDFSTLEKVRNAEVVPPTQYNPSIPESLEQVVLKALSRERDERYQWAMELHDDLQRYLIEGETIFNAKRLGDLLRGNYQADIDDEKQKMEKFQRLAPPSTALEAAVEQHAQAVPTADWGDNRAEKTMIFESGFGAPGGVVPQTLSERAQAARLPAPPTLNQSATVLPGAAAAVAAKNLGQPPASRRSLPFLLAFGALALMAAVSLVYLMLGNERASGTLMVTSTPTDNVDIFMDDKLIAHHTPIVAPNVPTGSHTLLARAAGYGDKAYRFDLSTGSAEIKVKLEPLTGTAPQPSSPEGQSAAASPAGSTASAGEAGLGPRGAEVEIESSPSMATVRLGGVPQGTTPTTVPMPDVANPLVLEVLKSGYVSQLVTITLEPGERHKVVHIDLPPVAGEAAAPALPAELTPGKLILHSHPDGCTIVLNGQEQGTTPRDLSNLDPRQTFSLELRKDGFTTYQETIRFAGRTAVAVSPTLRPERRRPPAKSAGGGACTGLAGRVSIMPVGIADCRVLIGRTSLGIAPVFKKEAPTGRCTIDVRCPNGKRFTSVRTLRPGAEEKIIIKPTDWR
jgi:serine/threonine protein kinase